jgi:hypothetical protein
VNSLPLPMPNTSAEIPLETSAAKQESNSPALRPKAQTLTDLHASVGGPACNVSLCEQSYQSFRSSDCTYQPFSGPAGTVRGNSPAILKSRRPPIRNRAG